MGIKYLLKDFKIPKEMTVFTQEEGEDIFYIEPFERGGATTMGNLFRRVLLSSIQGYAVTAVRVHTGSRLLTSEYEQIDGIIEDSLDIIGKLRELKFIMDQENPDNMKRILTGTFKGMGQCTAAIFDVSDVTIINQDLVLFEAVEEVDLFFEIEVELGRGYVPSEVTEQRVEEEGTITVDAVFSPVDNVKFEVKNIRIGHKSDYEKLLLYITTDGTITPRDVLAQAAKIVKEHMTVLIDFNEEDVETRSEDENRLLEMKKLLQLSIDELELSSRSYNCLKTANITNIGELVQLSEKEIQALPNFGNKSMEEIQKKLAELNFTLGMKFPPEILS